MGFFFLSLSPRNLFILGKMCTAYRHTQTHHKIYREIILFLLFLYWNKRIYTLIRHSVDRNIYYMCLYICALCCTFWIVPEHCEHTKSYHTFILFLLLSCCCCCWLVDFFSCDAAYMFFVVLFCISMPCDAKRCMSV